MPHEIDPDLLESAPDGEDTMFTDWEDETDDTEELEAYADALREVVEAFHIEVHEPGEFRS